MPPKKAVGDRGRPAEVAPTEPTQNPVVWTALGIFSLALAVRLVHLWQLRGSPFFTILMGDSRGYDEWALRIAAGDWWGHEVFYQAPLYPYTLGVLYAVAGRSLLLVRIVQAAIGSASCVLLGLAGQRLFSRQAGIVAGIMLALYAPAIFSDALLQKSVLDVFFVCLALWLSSRIISAHFEPDRPASPAARLRTGAGHTAPADRGNPGLPLAGARDRQPDVSWLWLGLAIGGLSLTRENALVFVIVILAWALFGFDAGSPASDRRPTPLARRLTRSAVFLAGLALVLVPVAARNSMVGGGFYVTTSQFGPNFFIGNNPEADGTYQSLRFGRGAPEFERQDATELAEFSSGRSLSPSEVSSYWTGRAMDFITGQPAAWLRLVGRKFLLLWNASEMLDTESQAAHADWSLPLRVLGPFGHFGVLVPLAVFGLIVTWGQRSRLWLLYALTAAYGASVVVFYVFARYRFPLVPFLMLFAAAGAATVPDAVRRRLIPGRARTVAVLTGVAVFTNWPVLSADSMRAVTENNLGVTLQGDGQFTEAVRHYERAVALDTNYAPAYSNMGTALRAAGRLDEAVAAYQRALRLQPAFPDAHYNLANALTDEGNPDQAVEHFRIALRSIPGSIEVHNNLGIALAAQGHAEEALAEFQAALRIDPASAKTLRNLGDTLASLGRKSEGIESLRRSIELDPRDTSAHYNLGIVLLEEGRLDEAVAEFRSALALSPNSVEAHNNLGIALGSQGKLDDAIDQFQQALALQPGFVDAQRNLAMTQQAKERR